MEDQIAHKTFLSYSDGEQKAFIDWIYSAKTDETKVKRIAKTLNRLTKGQKEYISCSTSKPFLQKYISGLATKTSNLFLSILICHTYCSFVKGKC
jgi:hypothetical protein